MSLIEAYEISKVCEKSRLKCISFDIDEKGVYGFLGKEGSGKSLLCEVLAGACDIDEGRLCYKGRALYENEKDTAKAKLKIGYVAQHSFFDRDMTVLELLDIEGKIKCVDPDKRFRQIKEALELTDLSDKREVLIEDITLSEKKRLGIAAALIGNPDVIIMDEPFQYLDKNQANAVKEIIRMVRNKKVILIFTRRDDDIREISDTIAFLHAGELILWKNGSELLKTLEENKLGSLDDALVALTEEDCLRGLE